MRSSRNVGKDKSAISRSQVVLMVEKLQELMLLVGAVSDYRNEFLASFYTWSIGEGILFAPRPLVLHLHDVWVNVRHRDSNPSADESL